MELQEFIQNFAEQFEETDTAIFNESTRFRNLGEWSSLLALSVLAMIDEEYDVQLPVEEMRCAQTIKELFDLVSSKIVQ